jgi:hypothetical protein
MAADFHKSYRYWEEEIRNRKLIIKSGASSLYELCRSGKGMDKRACSASS